MKRTLDSAAAGAGDRLALVGPDGQFADVPADLAGLRTVFVEAWGLSGYSARPFVPGMHPRSLLRADLAAVGPATLVGAKSDGDRMQVVLLASKVLALVDRGFRVEFSAREPGLALGVTVLDAELVGRQLLVHDAVMVHGSRLLDRPFATRLQAVARVLPILAPVLDRHGYQLVAKPFARLDAADLAGLLAPGSDGVILADPAAKLRNGVSPPGALLKWKSQHTVDLWFWSGCWWCGDRDATRPVRLAGLGLAQADPGAPPSFQELSNRAPVFEVLLSSQPGLPQEQHQEPTPDPELAGLAATVERRREDKCTANDWLVVQRTAQNAREDVQLAEIQARART